MRMQPISKMAIRSRKKRLKTMKRREIAINRIYANVDSSLRMTTLAKISRKVELLSKLRCVVSTSKMVTQRHLSAREPLVAMIS